LEATCDPLNGRWLLVLAAVRRALAIRQPIRASRRTSTDRALWDHNWDSNAVLCETWQIPVANTSCASQKGAGKGAFSLSQRRPGRPVPRLKWIMGVRVAQCGVGCCAEVRLPRWTSAGEWVAQSHRAEPSCRASAHHLCASDDPR